MNRNEYAKAWYAASTWAQCVAAGLLIGAVIGACAATWDLIGSLDVAKRMEHDAIQAGVAHYDAETGKFAWKRGCK